MVFTQYYGYVCIADCHSVMDQPKSTMLAALAEEFSFPVFKLRGILHQATIR
jgi:hypothetical protein